MKFNDRGISCKSHPSEWELEGEIGNKYSGTSCKQKYPRHIPANFPRIDQKYREVGYYTGAPEDVEAMRQRHAKTDISSAPKIKNNEAALTKNSRQQGLEKLHNIHLNNIRRNLEHRLQVARSKGDKDLIRLLEAEFEQIA